MNLKFTSSVIAAPESYVSNLLKRTHPAVRASAIGLNSLFVLLSLSTNAFSAESNPKASSGLLLVCNKGDHTLGIIDPVAGRQVAAIPEDGITGAVIDPKTLKVIRSIPTDQDESHMLVISHDGRRGYTANVAPGTVSVLDLEAGKVLSVIPICRNTQRIAISEDDRWVFTADQTKPQLAVIDTAANKVANWIPLPGIAYGTAPTPDGRWLLVTLIKDNKVGVVDLQTMKVARTLEVPRAPQEIVVRPDGASAYVSCDASRQVAVVDLKNWNIEKLVDAGAGADGLAWAKGE